MLARRSLLGGLVTLATPAACSRPDPAPPGPASADRPAGAPTSPPASSTTPGRALPDRGAAGGSAPSGASRAATAAGEAASAARGGQAGAAASVGASATASGAGLVAVVRREEVAGVAAVTWLRTAKGQDAVLVVPAWGPGPWPLLVALHGLGEARKGGEGGAYGWVRDYDLVKAMGRLHAPPLTRDDLQKIYDQRRVDALNEALGQRAFGGLAVLCPYTPDLLQERTLDNAGPFADHLVETLLPGVRALEPSLATRREQTGIDGVSLGGRVALLTGLRHPEVFSAVGSLQAALQMNEARPLARRVAEARRKAPLSLRLLTSERDFYRQEIGALHRELDRAGESHEHLVVPGPHDYPFNRGPGAVEMLLWHDRKLRAAG